jgi:hypothetical protein
MNDTTIQSDGVNEFLMTIPEAKGFLMNKERDRPQRIEVFQAIYRRITERLSSSGDLAYDWLLQVIEFELEQEDTLDKASYIARLLTSYVVNRPWVFHLQTMRPKLSGLIHNPDSQIAVSARSSCDKNFISDYENVLDLLNHHESKANNTVQMSNITINENGSNSLETIKKRSEMLAQSDTILGIAGFLPFTEEFEIDDATSPQIPTLTSSMETEDEFISQFRNHIELEGNSSRQCARITFLPRSLRYGKVAKLSSMADAKLSLDHGIMSLVSQIGILQKESGHLDRVLFIRSRPSEYFLWKEGKKRPYAEVASIDMGTIKKFIQVYGETRRTFERCLPNTLEVDYPSLNMGFHYFNIITCAVVSAAMFPSHPILGIIFIVFGLGRTFHVIGTYYYRSKQHLALDIVATKNLDSLLKTLEPICDSIGIQSLEPRGSPNKAAIGSKSVIETFHLTALVVQTLCLMFQSYLRGSMTPFHFDFLTSPISDFILEGASPQVRSRKIYASSQRLSCLGDMLKEDVLVFGSQPLLPQERLDLVAIAAQIVSIWGPAELVIRQNHELVLGRNHPGVIWIGPGPRKTTNSKATPSANGITSIVGIRIQGGVIFPTGETIHGLQQWHWRSINPIDKKYSWLVPSTEKGIDLHSNIRIGAIESRLSFHPIGPATWNQNCPSSIVLDLYQCFSSNMKVVGVKDPSISFKSLTLGLQGGQYVNVIAQGTFETEPGTPAKQKAIWSMGLFKVQLAEYDRMWGLFVSLCTGVMARVRLREIVAFFCLQFEAMDIPQQPCKSYEESLDAFTEALCGEGSIIDWVESLIPGPEKEDHGKRETLQQRVVSLFRNALVHLEATGISDNGDLVLACLPEGKPLSTINLSANDHPWVKVLSDSTLTATFACVSLYCFQARDCKCRRNEWSVPNEFWLATKLDLHARSAFSPGDRQQERLQATRTYWINSSDLNLMATVIGCTKEPDSELCYYVTIKKSVLPIDLVKLLRKKPIIREDDSPNAVKCIISGGSKFSRQLEELKQEGRIKTQSA